MLGLGQLKSLHIALYSGLDGSFSDSLSTLFPVGQKTFAVDAGGGGPKWG